MVEADVAELQEDLKRLEARNAALEAENESMRNRLEWLLRQVFGRKTEKQPAPEQPMLFDTEGEEKAQSVEEPQAVVTVEGHTRKKAIRKALPEWLPREEVVIDIDEADKQCGCGHAMVRIGEETSEKLDVIPAQFIVVKIIRPKYACKHCEGSGDEEKPAVRIAPMPKAVIERGMATPGLLAFIITAKYVDALPLARQEKQFARMGIELPRQRLSDWVIAVGLAVRPVMRILVQLLRAGPIMLADETRVQMLGRSEETPTRLSYMWAAYGGEPEQPVVYFRYDEHRSREAAEELVGDYEGFFQTDAFKVYDLLCAERPELIHVGCWAHARRKFFDATGGAKKPTAAHQALSLIAKLYRVEQELSGIPRDEEFVSRRKERVEPVLGELHAWLEKKAVQVPPSTLLGKAVGYTLGQWEKLIRYLDHPQLTPDTNRVENKIRPFVVGRKNWLFSGSPSGAEAAANLYSLIETAKANGIEPYRYLRALIERLPNAVTDDDYRSLLPQFIDLPPR